MCLYSCTDTNKQLGSKILTKEKCVVSPTTAFLHMIPGWALTITNEEEQDLHNHYRLFQWHNTVVGRIMLMLACAQQNKTSGQNRSRNLQNHVDVGGFLCAFVYLFIYFFYAEFRCNNLQMWFLTDLLGFQHIAFTVKYLVVSSVKCATC